MLRKLKSVVVFLKKIILILQMYISKIIIYLNYGERYENMIDHRNYICIHTT